MIIFIEQWTAKDSWRGLAQEERGEYFAQPGASIQGSVESGVEILRRGINENSVPTK